MRKCYLIILMGFLCLLGTQAMAQSNYYWIGGSGSWSDTNHWATTSGGAVLHTVVPTSDDTVIFDANSFTTAGQIVTLDVDGYCNDMDWSGVTNFPSFIESGGDLFVYGSLTYSPDMTSDLNIIEFWSSETGETITSNGTSLGSGANVRFQGTGEYSLLDPLEANIIFHQQGTLITNNHNITLGNSFNMTGSSTRTLQLGSSTITCSGSFYVNGNNLTIDAGTSTISAGNFYGDNQGSGPYTFYDLEMPNGGNIYNNATFNEIRLTAGEEVSIDAGDTLTVNSLVAVGEKVSLITLNSRTAGSQAHIQKTSGTVDISYVVLQDINAFGGATFNADFAVDNGNNTGWNITALTGSDYYWIGGTGNWSDPDNWATTSGGAVTHGDYPGSIDNVFFDANSFASTGTVTVDISDAACHDMDWTGVTNTPTFSAPYAQPINIYGSVTFSDDVTKSINNINFRSTDAETIWMGQGGFASFLGFYGGGTYTLKDSIDAASITLTNGTLNLNGQYVMLDFDMYVEGYSGTTVNLGASELHMRSWTVNGTTNLTINSGTSHIYMTTTFDGEGYNYHNVTMDGTVTVTGANTFDTLTIAPGSDVNFDDGVTQTFDQLIAEGTKVNPITLTSALGGVQATFSMASGTVAGTYLNLQDMNATGGATFNAESSVDNGNNTGWNITAVTGEDYYWVGGTGNWTDFANHWATTSGGSTFHTGEPGQLDNAIFDANSFTASNETVTIDLDEVSINDLDWSGIDETTTFTGSGKTINIYGSLALSENLVGNVSTWSFYSDTVETIAASYGPGNNTTMNFLGSGEWQLQDSVLCRNLFHQNGTITTNDQFVYVTFEWDASTANTKVVNAGESELWIRIFDLSSATNLSFDADSASIRYSSDFKPNTTGTGNDFSLRKLIMDNFNATDEARTDGSFSVDTLEIGPGIQAQIQAGTTITVGQLIAEGTELEPIIIESRTAGSAGTISQASGTVEGNYLQLQDNIATGGATFNAYNSVNNGNVSGWTFFKSDQTITFDSIPDKVFGDPDFTISATASSGLDVTLEVISGPAVLTNDTVSITGAGVVKIQASQDGDIDYNPAASVIREFTVEQAGQTIDFTLGTTSYALNDPDFELSATSSVGLTVSFSSSNTDVIVIVGTTASIVGAGTATITASQAGDGDYSAAADVAIEVTVAQESQTISFDAITDKLVTDADFALSAAATSGLEVTFSSSDETVVSITGTTASIVGAGTVTITASQAGNTDYSAAADVEQTITVSKLDQTITFDALPDVDVTDPDFDLTATASSGLTVTYTSSDETVATVTGSTVSIIGEGFVTITASQAGDATYNAAADVEQSFSVGKLSQTIDFPHPGDLFYDDGNFTLDATASSGLTVTFSSSDESLATITGSVLTIVAPGTVTITASQAGNAEYTAAPDVSIDIVINKAYQYIDFASFADYTFGDDGFNLSASVSTGNPVIFSSDNPSVATVNGTRVTIVGAGSAQISAFVEETEFYQAEGVEQTLNVYQAEQAVLFDPLPDFTLDVDNPFNLEATATSGLIVTYSVSGPATLDSALVTPTGAGTVTVTASQTGDNNFFPAEDVIQSFLVTTLATGLEDEIRSYLLVYPNPARSHITLSLDQYNEEIMVQLTDLQGKMLSQRAWFPAEKLQLSLKGLEHGTYLVRLSNDDFAHTIRIVVN